jgi:seryl-tRNA synthetase
MIDLEALRADPDRFRRGAAHKHYDPTLVDRLLETDAALRTAMTTQQELTAEKNRLGREIGRLAAQAKQASAGEKPAIEEQLTRLRQRPLEIKPEEDALVERVRALEAERAALWLRVPQPADADVPVGAGPDDNVERRAWNPAGYDVRKSFADNRGFEPKSHIELMQRHGMVDLERGVRMAGSRSYVLTGDGMRLSQAILRHAFDFMTQEHGFTPMSVPVLVRDELMVGTGFFPDGREQAYAIGNPTSEHAGCSLTGTGEVGLMGLHMDEILAADNLPLRYTTVSPCFRREAGAAGRDTAGLYRVHYFEKVEQVVICRADEAESRAWHQKMIGYVESLLQRLELPYRLLQCCTGDLGPKNADQVDIECWMPSRASYGETHSASRLYDYQCRRLNLRYKDPDSGRNVCCHSLNNTVAASPRILIPLIEMHQQADGSIAIPAPLRAHMGGRETIG